VGTVVSSGRFTGVGEQDNRQRGAICTKRVLDSGVPVSGLQNRVYPFRVYLILSCATEKHLNDPTEDRVSTDLDVDSGLIALDEIVMWQADG
jgi:hypothetical protein